MKRISLHLLHVLIFLSFLLVLFSGCEKKTVERLDQYQVFKSFRDVPGITDDEIKAIEFFQQQKRVFVYGMPLSTEAFKNEIGEIQGFSARFCSWLSELFGITFQNTQYELSDLLAGLERNTIDFTGELRATEERLKNYYMTDPIGERIIKYFTLKSTPPISSITNSQKLRIGFIEGATTANTVTSRMKSNTYEVIFVNSIDQVYGKLKSGEIDAFFYSNPVESRFDEYEDVIARNFFPLIFSPVSLSTKNPELEPIISVVQKTLKNGSFGFLAKEYSLGYEEYLKTRFYLQLTEEERAFIRENPIIPMVADHYNYPVSFYNHYEKEWQGIVFDMLDKISDLTGLSFKLVHDQHSDWPVIFEILKSGKASLATELLPSQERMGNFLWPKTPTLTNNYYTLLSKSETRNISINEIMNVKVGLPKGTAYAEMFRTWFPDNINAVEYISSDECFAALERDEIDMVISSQHRLLALTNYHEYSGYKANFVFDQVSESFMGFNKNETVLCSIFDKALPLINVKSISDQWMNRTYDYKAKIAKAQRPWLIGASFLLLFVLFLLFILFLRNRFEGRRLEKLVQQRTLELIKLQQNLETALKDAQGANTAKSKFLANMSHEIRTPMNVILGITDSMLLTESIPKKIKEAFDRIYDSSHLLLNIINDILDLSKIEAGKLELNLVKYEVLSLINDTANLNVIQFEHKQIKFLLRVDENIPLYLYGDELRIKQILNNLLSNAFKYTMTGEVLLSFTVENTEEDKTTIVICVRDTGQGMTKEQIDKLYDEYSRFNLEANRTTSGTGLGMAITNNLIKMMNGKISVESAPGVGTKFIIHIPQKITKPGLLGKEAAENLQNFNFAISKTRKHIKITREPMPYGKVLVVDDMKSNLEVAKLLLTPYALQVEAAESGFEAIELIKSGSSYDIIFMDFMMPQMDGLEATKILREIGYKDPIIALTANAIARQQEVFLANGFDGFISKPIDLRQLNDSLNKFIRDKERNRLKENSSVVNSVIENPASGSDDDISTGNDIPVLDIQIPGINAETGLSLYEDDTEVYIAVLRVFIPNALDLVEKMKNVTKETLSDYVINVHGLKGISSGIGAEDLRSLSYELEKISKSGDLDEIPAKNEKLLNDTLDLVTNIKVWLSEYDENN